MILKSGLLQEESSSINDRNIEDIFTEYQHRCEKIIAKNYLLIRGSLESLKQKGVKRNLNIKNENDITWLIIFPITWLCRYKIREYLNLINRLKFAMTN